MAKRTTNQKLTLAHVTHEAVEQLGGIGTVLAGLITSPVYQKEVKRSILIGPTSAHVATNPESRLGEFGKVLYSSVDGLDRGKYGEKFHPIEEAFHVRVVYGTRTFAGDGDGRTGDAEVILIDVFGSNKDRLNQLKARLWERYGLESWRYENGWDYEEYVRLAEPAVCLLKALLGKADFPCVLVSHEFMGIATCLEAMLDDPAKFRTVFHAHECATARRIVEEHPGHDTMFYNVIRQVRGLRLYAEHLFPGLNDWFRHALVSRTHLFDGIIAVGDYTRDEIQFLSEKFDDHPIDLVYNGLSAMKVTPAIKQRSRGMLLDYSQVLLGYRPDVLMSHVTRPVISKGIWRDALVCHEMEAELAKCDKTAVLYILTSGGGVRRPQDVQAMEQNYNWPRNHHSGYPDLMGPESGLFEMTQEFNSRHRSIQMVLVNQFGWSQSRIGRRVHPHMDMADFRRAVDVEFGMAIYEPFGISPLEPLGSGALCVISNVCGCQGFVKHITKGRGTANVIVADYTKLDEERSIEQLQAMQQNERDAIEVVESQRIAGAIMKNLPWTEEARGKLIRQGQALVAQMGWDQVIQEGMLPMFHRIRALPGGNGKKR